MGWTDTDQQWPDDTAGVPAPVVPAAGTFAGSGDWATQVQEEFPAAGAQPTTETNWASPTSNWA